MECRANETATPFLHVLQRGPRGGIVHIRLQAEMVGRVLDPGRSALRGKLQFVDRTARSAQGNQYGGVATHGPCCTPAHGKSRCMAETAIQAVPAQATTFGGHPRGLQTLFFTEMWERFSYYGMRAILILFMTARTEVGGLGWDAKRAATTYGLYTAGVYFTAIPGGWIADRLLGLRRAVMVGGILIALGHYSLALNIRPAFFAGLVLIVLGTGLLKPNISSIVGQLYAPDDARRDAGFSIFYMGINTGALIAPIICGYLGQRVGWHWGFGAAGVGMTLGLVQYAL